LRENEPRNNRKDPRTLRVVLVTNLYPVANSPERGVFVRRQVEALNRLLSHPIQIVIVGRTGAGGLQESRNAVWRACDESPPDLLHVYYGLSGSAVPLRLRIPMVVSLCGSDVLSWHVGKRPRGFVEYLVSVATVARARGVIAQSGCIRTALPIERLRRKVTLLPSGIDRTRFRPLDPRACRERLGWPRDAPIVLFPADARRPEKQYSLARAAVSLVPWKGSELVLRDMAGVPPDDVPLYLNAADCVLITSAWEAGPIVLSEAMACGTPVVSVPVGYARDLGDRAPSLRVVPPIPALLARAVEESVMRRPAFLPVEESPFPTDDEYADRLLALYANAAAEG